MLLIGLMECREANKCAAEWKHYPAGNKQTGPWKMPCYAMHNDWKSKRPGERTGPFVKMLIGESAAQSRPAFLRVAKAPFLFMVLRARQLSFMRM